MNLYQIREAISRAMAAGDDAKVTELIIQRDALRAAETKPADVDADAHHALMLDATHA